VETAPELPQPACPASHACVNGQCVLICNPPCVDGERCTDAGKCVRPTTPDAPASSDAWTLPSERRRSGGYLHDGFYARLAFGAAYSWGSGSVSPLSLQDPEEGAELDFAGQGPSFLLFVGGTLPGGVAIGGAVMSTLAGEPTYETPDGRRKGGTVGLPFIGLFADWYPDPSGGLHLLGALGIGAATYAEDDSIPPRDLAASGFALAGGVGYDLFVGRDFSMGALPVLQYARSSFDPGESEATGTVETMAVSLLFAMTYN